MESGGSASGSLTKSTLSREENFAMSSEDSSTPEESGLELCLGLSLGGGGGKDQQGQRGHFARILTAKDFPSVGFSSSLASESSSSTSSLSSGNVAAGTKRSADSVAAANGASQVVGWPPIRAYRMNSLVLQAKSSSTEGLNSVNEKSEYKTGAEKVNNGGHKSNGNAKEIGQQRGSLFVKVNMDGIPIGRKVNLSAHSSYEALAQKLEDMFGPSTHGSGGQEMEGATRPSKLLDGSFEFALTYEDKDGDWMLVGDVPWEMFLGTVKRLRIMRTSEANGLAPLLQEKNVRQRCKPT
ncbi:hypothetical protein ACFX2I_004005 [Malus domestica]|uniref:Auxin-responsive protein n=1 Tax=Malus domestica TaxID=3750 RepID=D9ZIN3_MALDO|nr:auxin-responsive protein IAA11-like [Malus domestica]ADL36586.1 ARF domain class transcription factor [Malus domestica]